MKPSHLRMVAFACALAVLAFGLPIAAAQTGEEPVSNDPYAGLQWGLDRIRAPDAWELATGDGIKVATIGWGIDLDHPDLADVNHCPGKLEAAEEYNLEGGPASNTSPTNSYDTHAAGIIASCTDNGRGIAGVAPDATIMPFKIFSSSNNSTRHLVAAIDKAVDSGAHAILLPPRGAATVLMDEAADQAGITLTDKAALKTAIDNAMGAGTVLVAGAGDLGAGGLRADTCAYSKVSTTILCAVGAGPFDLHPAYSPSADNRGGPVVAAPAGLGVRAAICDPQLSVLSLWSSKSFGRCGVDEIGYEGIDSTFSAAAHVVGVTALAYERLAGERSERHGRDVIDAIVGNAADVGPSGRDPLFGSGMLDARATVESLGDQEPSPSPTASPSESPTASPSESPTASPSESPSGTPDDPLFDLQWGLSRIRAPEVWDTTTGAGITTAVVDSGVDVDHPDLSCAAKIRVIDRADVGQRDDDPDDEDGHGTHLAGIIGACTDNGSGIAGIAPDATVMPIRIVGDDGAPSVDHLAEAIRRARDNRAHVINLAFTTAVPATIPAVEEQIARAVDEGIVVVAAAGNSSMALCGYPAIARRVVCVGATDKDDNKAWYSSFANKHNYAVVAPGGLGGGSAFCDLNEHNIVSAHTDDCFGDGPGYRALGGTSMASAHVSGVAALLYAQLGAERKFGKVDKIRHALVTGARDLGPAGEDPAYGAGLIDAVGAVELLAGGTGAPPGSEDGIVPALSPIFDTSRPGRVARASLTSEGVELDGASWTPDMSGDGRYVAFVTSAPNIRPQGNPFPQVYVKDMLTGEIELVSKSSRGVAGNFCSFDPSISSDGRYVAFASGADNLVPDDTNGDQDFACLFPDVFVHDRVTGTTTRVSVNSKGEQAEEHGAEVPKSFVPSISGDGTKVAFFSTSDNLSFTGDGGPRGHLYLHDRPTGVTSMLDVDEEGNPGTGTPRAPDLSHDGRYATFSYDVHDHNLISSDDSFNGSVYVRDVEAGTIEVISVNSDGEGANNTSRFPAISANGRFVAFASSASNLVPDDIHHIPGVSGSFQIYLRDRKRGTTERVSVLSDGRDPIDSFADPEMSVDGRYVTFFAYRFSYPDEEKRNVNTVPIRTVMLHDRTLGTTELIPVNRGGEEANDHSSGIGRPGDNIRERAPVSSDGRYVAFPSYGWNLVEDDGNGAVDVFVRDRGPEIGAADVGAVDAGGALSVSGWATFSGAEVASVTDEAGDVQDAVGDQRLGTDLTAARLVYRPHIGDLLIEWTVDEMPYIRATRRHEGRDVGPLRPSLARPGIVYALSFTVGGQAYEIRGSRLGRPNTRHATDANFALLSCDDACESIAELDGGIGTTGPVARVSLPLQLVGAGEGNILGAAEAFTAAGLTYAGPLVPIDSATLGDGAIPGRTIELGVAEHPSDRSDVEFAYTAPAAADGFSGIIPRSAVHWVDYDVWAKACLGDTCGAFRRLRAHEIPAMERVPLPPEVDPDPEPTPRPTDPSLGDQRPPIDYLWAAPGTTKILAGESFGDGGPARQATIGNPAGLELGQKGLYIADTYHHQIRVVDTDGVISLVAGSSLGFRDGSLRAARFRYPEGIAVDDAGRVYVADRYNDRIRVIDPHLQSVTTVAGTGEESYDGDGGPAIDAALWEPRDVALHGDLLYIADYQNHVVRKIDLRSGEITTFAGTGFAGPALDGDADKSPIGGPSSVAVDDGGNVYIVDTGNCLVRKVDPSGRITTVAGTQIRDASGTNCFSDGDGGPATAAHLDRPHSVDVGLDGTIYITEGSTEGRVRAVAPDGTITTIAGNGEGGCPENADDATATVLTLPSAVVVGADGSVYISTLIDPRGLGCSRVFRLDAGAIERVAGSGDHHLLGAEPGMHASGASFHLLSSVAYGLDGQPYFTSDGTRIWTITPDGRLDIVAGGRTRQSPGQASVDGPAMDARFAMIAALEFDDEGRLWIVDRTAAKIKVLENGVVRTLAGNGRFEGPEAKVGVDGPALEVRLDRPHDLAIADDGAVYFTEAAREGRIRVLRDGEVVTVGGDVDYSGDCDDDGDCADDRYYDGDGGPVSEAEFQWPQGIDIGPDGSLYVADHGNHRIRRIAPDGIVSTIAGDGGLEHGTDPPRRNGFATLQSIPYPNEIAVDDDGNVFVTDAPDFTFEPSDSVVWHISPRGMLTRVAGGTGEWQQGPSGPMLGEKGPSGPSLESALESPRSIAVTPAGLLVGDFTSLRLVAPPADGWPDPDPAVRCDPFGYNDRTGEVTYMPDDAQFGPRKEWLDIVGGDVTTTTSEIRVEIDILDLSDSLGELPPVDEGDPQYLWSYVFQDADIQDGSSTTNPDGSGPIFAYYIAAKAATPQSPPVFEYGIADAVNRSSRHHLWVPTPFGEATGTIDIESDRVTLIAPVEGFSSPPEGAAIDRELGLEAGERIVYQEFAAGTVMAQGNHRLMDRAPNLRSRAGKYGFGSGTTRSYEIGKNCEDYGPLAPETAPPPPVQPKLPEEPDEYLDLQWALKRIAARSAWSDMDVTGTGIKVAVIDSGIELDHEDFSCAGKLGPGAAMVDGRIDERRSALEDVNGHGTQVAGVVAACANNSVGIAGTAPDVTLLPYRVLSDDGELDFRDVGAAVRHATRAGAHVINLSLGPVAAAASYGPDVFEEEDTQAIEDAIDAGVVVVAAAGNDSFPLCSYPALVKDVICVGATDRFDLKSWYSTFPNKIDGGPALVAPGGTGTAFCDFSSLDIITTNSLDHDSDCDGREGYATSSGTSLATPHVSGAAALVYGALDVERSPSARADVVAALTSTAVDYGTRGYDPVYGYGRLDAFQAVKSVMPTPPHNPAPSAPSPSASLSPSASPSASTPPSISPSPSPSAVASEGKVSTTVTRDRSRTRFRKPVLLSGRVTADDDCEGPFAIDILKRRHGKTRYRVVDTFKVGDRGMWVKKIRSKRSAFYIARPQDTATCSGETAAPVGIKVRSKVAAKRLYKCGTRPRLRGVVRPNHKGTKVALKKKKGGKWRRMDRDRLDHRSRFVLHPPTCKGHYRVVWPKQAPDNIRGRVAFRAKALKNRR